MMSNKIHCFLPCRSGSQRVPKKNIKPFAGNEFGLIEIKLRQLIDVEEIDTIFLSTNDEVILDYARSLHSEKLFIHHRCEELSSSETSTDDLVAHALDLVQTGHILWTHVTSPFINASNYRQIIDQYRTALDENYDSLMTTTLIQSFLWKDGAPLNYNRSDEKWPRTQTIEPVHEVNSGGFIASCSVYERCRDRIGETPFLMPLEHNTGFDIDWPSDFELAEQMALKGLVSL